MLLFSGPAVQASAQGLHVKASQHTPCLTALCSCLTAGMAVSEAVSSGIDALFETASDAPIANEGTRNDAKQGNSFVTQKASA